VATREHVVYQANQIARNFSVLGVERAAAATADHIRSFWAPYLKSVLLDEFRHHEDRFTPIARRAVGNIAN
jgi:formate dehydrogenase subunit delta